MAQARKKRVDGNAKGGRAEREVAAYLQQWWRRFESSAEFARTPKSGGWRKDLNIAAHFKACGDIMTTAKRFPFCVESKWHERWSIDRVIDGKTGPHWDWWAQAVAAAAKQQDSVPMMWIRRARVRRTRESFPWLVWLPAWYVDDQRLSEPDVSWTVQLLRENGVDFSATLPVVYRYERFLKMAPKRMATP